MTTLALLFGFVFAAILLPLLLLKALFALVMVAIAIPLKILGGLVRGVIKGALWLALLIIPLAFVALPLMLMAVAAWILYRSVRGRPQAAYA